jgi:hypothetical protein
MDKQELAIDKRGAAIAIEELGLLTPPQLLSLIESPSFRAGKFQRFIQQLRDAYSYPVTMWGTGIGKDASPEMRAWAAILYVQSIYWREKFEGLSESVMDSGLGDRVGARKSLKAMEQLAQAGRDQRKKLSRSRRIGRGRRSIDIHYDWLAAIHHQPRLQEALGVSRTGFGKTADRIGIGITRSTDKKKSANKIACQDALKCLDVRLISRRAKEEKSAQQIWDAYGCHRENRSGFAELRRVLTQHGAICIMPARISMTIFDPLGVAHS